jgi:hypothetical protein
MTHCTEPITLIHDSETPFYHDWVVPAGYFSDRGCEVPPAVRRSMRPSKPAQ